MIVDCHSHYLSPRVKAAVQAGRWQGQIAYDVDSETFLFPTFRSRPTPSGMVDVDARIRHLDDIGVDRQILSTWIDMFGPDLPVETAADYHRQVNEGMALAVSGHPDRLHFLASVPLPYGERAAEELRHAVTQLGALGTMMGTNVGGRGLDDPDFDSFWSEAERLDVPVMLHPVQVAAAAALPDYYLANLLGYPFDTTIAASQLIFGGVLDRFPRLRIVLLHGGGYLPYAVGRLDHGYHYRAECRGPGKTPSTYLNRFVYDHLVYDGTRLASLAQWVGQDRLVLGTDYPFDMEPPDVLGLAEAGLGPDAGQLLGENAARIFGLPGPR